LWRLCGNENQTDDRHSEIHIDSDPREKGLPRAGFDEFAEQFNSQYFMEYIMVPLVQEIFPYGRNRRALGLHVQLDNCRVHFSEVAEQFVAANEILRIPHLPYIPDLAPSDF
jgi:hypothetical protein